MNEGLGSKSRQENETIAGRPQCRLRLGTLRRHRTAQGTEIAGVAQAGEKETVCSQGESPQRTEVRQPAPQG